MIPFLFFISFSISSSKALDVVDNVDNVLQCTTGQHNYDICLA